MWNYRIVKTEERGETLYGLYEVFYDEKKPVARGMDPESFGGFETPDELVHSLAMALRDAQKQPVLDDLQEWPGFREDEE